MPTESMITVNPETGKYSIKFDFYTVIEDVWVGDFEVKLVLPEGCRWVVKLQIAIYLPFLYYLMF